MRTVPPDQSAEYAAQHDDAVWNTLWALLGEGAGPLPAAADHLALARSTGQLPGAMGGTSAVRIAPAAYWAAWADALPVMTARRPDAAARCVAELLARPAARAPSLRQANAAADQDGRLFLHGTPCKLHLRRLPTADPYPGWQQPTTRALHIHYRESELLPHLTPPCQALLRSQSGPHASRLTISKPRSAAGCASP